MSQRIGTYSAKGALSTAILCIVLMGGGVAVMYMSTSEALECARATGGRAACRLTRAVLGVPLPTNLGFVQAAEVKVSEDTRTFGIQAGRRAYRAVAWVQYYTDAGWVSGAQGHDVGEPQRLVDGLTTYLAAPSQATFVARITGNPTGYRYARWAFVAGASLQGLWLLGWLFPAMRPSGRSAKG